MYSSWPHGAQKSRGWTPIWKAAVGGDIGWMVYIIYTVIRHPNPYNFLFFLKLPQFMIIGAIMGGIVGFVIWKYAALRREWPGPLTRVVIGVCLTAAIALLLNLVSAEPQSIIASDSKASFIVDFCVGVIIIGSASGLPAGPKHLEAAGTAGNLRLTNHNTDCDDQRL